ncbi:hypothetical protein RF11_13076 [Thelohanellus kitauei]|uniref:Uncharacterized protein n=1 Tax=Thelohanellus kitauei TaxID=669202 RepID=A0A0C2N0F0_THEKT|nr:hypothetical protein RF11_13076 [Thelohanellus kitauei]
MYCLKVYSLTDNFAFIERICLNPKLLTFVSRIERKLTRAEKPGLRKTRLFVSDNLLLLYCLGYDFSIQLAIRETQLSRPNAIDNFISFGNSCFNGRQVWADNLNDNREVIGGPGVEVGIDESLFYERKYNRGRILVNRWFFGDVERHDH